MIFGTRRLWCDETINWVDGIDDRYVAIRGHRNAFVYDHRTGEQVTGIDPASITSGNGPYHPSIEPDAVKRDRWTKVSSDGKWAAIATLGSRLRVFDNTTGEMKFPDDPSCGFDELVFSPDGSRIAALAHGAYVLGETTVRIPAIQYGLAFAGDDLVGGRVGRLARWSLDGTERARVSVRHKIDSLSFTRDGRYASATTMWTGGLCLDMLPDVVVGDLERGVAILRFHDKADVTRQAKLSPDGRWLVLQTDVRMRLMSATPRAPWSVPPVLLEWEDRGLMFAHDRAISIDAHAIATPVELPTGEPVGPSAKLDGSLRVSAFGFLEVMPNLRHVRLRDRDLAIVREREFEQYLEEIAISPDGKRIAISNGPTIEIVDL